MATPTDPFGEFEDIFPVEEESLTEWTLKVTNFAPPILTDCVARTVVAMGHALQAAKTISYLEKKMKNLKQDMIELG